MKSEWIAIIGIFTLVFLTNPAFGVPKDPMASDNETYFLQQFGLTLDNIFWGEFHSHSNYSTDASKCQAYSPDRAYRYARDMAKLNFVALSDHAEEQNAKAISFHHRREGLNNWQSLLKTNLQYNNEDPAKGKVFIIFPAWEYTNTYGLQNICGSAQGYGHKNVLFKSLNQDMLPENEYGVCNVATEYLVPDANSLWGVLQNYRPSEVGDEGAALTIIHTPANVGDGIGDPQDHRTDWGVMDPDFVRHVEIYSKWGNSEGPPTLGLGCSEEESFEYTSGPEGYPLSIRTTLYHYWVEQGNSNFLLGFIGGTDNHKGQPGNSSKNQCNYPYRGGITGIAAPDLTRDHLWTHLWKRHTLATSTGARIEILFAVETEGMHLFMGEQGDHNGTVRVRTLASTTAEKLELIVDGCVYSAVSGNALDTTLSLNPSRHYIYIRASIQNRSGELFKAWTSPVYLGMPAQ